MCLDCSSLARTGRGIMSRPVWASFLGGVSILLFAGLIAGQRPVGPVIVPDQLAVEHPECDYFGPQRDRFVREQLDRAGALTRTGPMSATSREVARMLGRIPGGSGSYNFAQNHPSCSIDSYAFDDFKKNNITPAQETSDWEFIRRVTLDLTGRIPAPH